MIAKVIQVGAEHGIELDDAVLKALNLQLGDQVEVTVQKGGAIVLKPLNHRIAPKDAGASAKSLIRTNPELFQRLSENG